MEMIEFTQSELQVYEIKCWKMKIQGLSSNWAELLAELVYLENGYRWQEEKISRDEIK